MQGKWTSTLTDRTTGRQWKNHEKREPDGSLFSLVAEWTGLEPATPGVTGRYSNRLNYHSALIVPSDSAEGAS